MKPAFLISDKLVDHPGSQQNTGPKCSALTLPLEGSILFPEQVALLESSLSNFQHHFSARS